MPTPATVIAVARAEKGYVEQGGPHGMDGNLTKYWAELQPSYEGEPWCAAFVSWVFKHAGAPLPFIDHAWGYSYCPDLEAMARQRGWIISGPRPGAISLYHFGSAAAQHTGICTSFDLGGSFTAVEGNTSPGSSGSQTNGGGVYERTRSTYGVVFVWPPVYDTVAPTPPPVKEEDMAEPGQAVDLVMFEDGTGYVLDRWGGIHAVGTVPVPTDGPFWKGQDVARRLVITKRSDGTTPPQGYVLDLKGGIHEFGKAVRPAVGPDTHYWD